ncbi:MAG: ABC transporter substrate-binding protein [Desulfosarcina sp.]
MLKRLIFFLPAVLAAIGLACVADISASEKLAKEQILNIAFDAGDLQTLDPHRAATTQDRSTVDPIFNGLIRYTPGNQAQAEPDLAESWTASADNKVWTFQLRKGVHFHPFPGHPQGYELTSEDVVYSFQRAANPDTSSYAGEYSGTIFEADGPYQVRITLEKPMSETLFLAKVANYAGGFIVPKKAIEAQGNDWFKLNPVGTGPFAFKSYEPRQKVVLIANDTYFRAKPHLREVVIRYMPSVSSRELGLQSGELQIIEGLKEDKWLEKVATFPDVVIKPFGPCETQVLFFNLGSEPFNDIRVRKAFSYAINREEVAAFMGKGLAVPIYAPTLAPPAPGALTKAEAEKAGVVYENNIAEAKRLLAEAGYDKGLKFEAIVSEMESSYRKPMIAVQAQVRKAGIDMQLKVVDHSAFHGLIRQDASPIVYYASWRPDVNVYLTRFFHSDSVVVNGKKPDTNFSHYGLVDANGDGTVDSVDALTEQARWELDAPKQIAMWKEAQVKILQDVAAVPIIRLMYAFPMKSNVDLGYDLEFSWQTYSPQINEKTRLLAH